MKKFISNISRLNDRSLNYGVRIIKSWLKKIEVENVLDIGAGKGRDLKILKSEKNVTNLHAIESFHDSVELLRKEGINVHEIDVEKEKFPFEEESLDLIIANQVLEHCKEIFWIHHEIFRTLKVGGFLIVGVPNLAAYYNRFNLAFFGSQPNCISLDGAHVRAFTKHGYKNFLKRAISGRFEIKDFKGANFVPFPNKFANFMSDLFPNSSTCIFFLIKKSSEYDGDFLKITNNLETPFWIGN